MLDNRSGFWDRSVFGPRLTINLMVRLISSRKLLSFLVSSSSRENRESSNPLRRNSGRVWVVRSIGDEFLRWILSWSYAKFVMFCRFWFRSEQCGVLVGLFRMRVKSNTELALTGSTTFGISIFQIMIFWGLRTQIKIFDEISHQKLFKNWWVWVGTGRKVGDSSATPRSFVSTLVDRTSLNQSSSFRWLRLWVLNVSIIPTFSQGAFQNCSCLPLVILQRANKNSETCSHKPTSESVTSGSLLETNPFPRIGSADWSGSGVSRGGTIFSFLCEVNQWPKLQGHWVGKVFGFEKPH